MFASVTWKTALYVAPEVTPNVALIGPRTCGDVPVQSTIRRSPSTVTVTWRVTGSATTPSSSMTSLNSYTPSGMAAISARIQRSE